MSEIIKFNTEDNSVIQQVDIFSLVGENNPILKTKCDEFDFENPPVNPMEFASSLVETCKIKGGYGLAANQCGYSFRVFVMGSGDEYVAMFNPKITSTSTKESIIAEGCLSFPMLALKISRPSEVNVEYFDFNGEKHNVSFSGLTSHIVQHELDHLDGIVYTERSKPMALKMGLKKRDKFRKLVDRYNAANEKLASVR